MSRFVPKTQEQKTTAPTVSQKASAKQQNADTQNPLQSNLLQLQQVIGNQATGQMMAQQIQRKAVQLKGGPEEEELQMKAVQRKGGGPEEEELQLKAAAPVQRKGKMPEDVQAKMETAFNTDFSGVNIHEGNKASDVGAIAYAQGNDIHFAQGKFQPNSQSGQELLGHELAHIVQQRQGRVQPTTQAKGLPINDDPALEQEADDLGRKAAQTKPKEEELV